MTAEPVGHKAPLDELRRRRAELRESMGKVEGSLADPVRDDPTGWLTAVAQCLLELRDDFAEHLEVTEGPDGLYQDLLATAPRLAVAVNRLKSEHHLVDEAFDRIGQLQASAADDEREIDTLRESVTALLALLSRHRQRGSDLVWEAYAFDVGGET